MVVDRSLQRMQLRDLVVEEMEKHDLLFSPRRVDRISRCSEVEVVSKDKAGRLHTLYAQRCHDRACPICQQIKHKKAAMFLAKVDKEERAKVEEAIGKSITDEAWYKRYKFVTLSPFVSSFELRDMADKLSWLSREFTSTLNYYFRAEVKPIGYFRTFEITYDPIKGYHPHMHAILLYPCRAPYVDQVKVERSLYKALAKTEFLGTLSDGRLQETVSIDIRDCYKKDQQFAEFELTKYIAKVEDFDDLSAYVRLVHSWGRVPQFRASGCFSGMSSSKKLAPIIQNANCMESKPHNVEHSEVVVFYGHSKNRVGYLVRPDIGVQAARFFRRQDLRKFNTNMILSAEDEQRRFFAYPYAFWFDSGGFHVKELPPWTEQDENDYYRACRLNIAFGSDLGKSKRFRVAPKILSEKLGYEQVCLMELI